MDDVTKFLLAQGVLGAFVILETALIWYLLGEVKRLSTRLENVNTIASRFDAYLAEVQPSDITQRQVDKYRQGLHPSSQFTPDK